MAWVDRKELYRRIEAARGSRVICYVTSDRQNAEAQIHKDVQPFFYERLVAMQEKGTIDLVLYTQGGDTLAAFGLCRLIREFAKKVCVLVPFRCHSAGSLLALGADEIVMTQGATLSPIDPSVVGPLNPVVEIAPGQRQVVPLSVETVAGFKDLVTKDWGIKGEEALTSALRVLAERVHPLALGNVYRARQQIEDLARKQLKSHRSDADTVLQGIIETFTRGLGSHDYPISRSDARGLLGNQIAPDSDEQEALIWSVYKDFAKEMRLREPADFAQLAATARLQAQGPGQPAVREVQQVAIVETTDGGAVAERELAVLSGQSGPVVQAQIVRAGWRHYS